MATCPFCNGNITEELALHGGPCPACFADIPGEETATDPGEEAAAQIRAADLERARRRARAPIAFIAPVVLVALAGTAWALWPEPQVEALAFGEDDFAFEIDLAAWEAPEEVDDGVASEAARPVRRAPAGNTGTDQPQAAGLSERLAAANASGGTSGGPQARSGSADDVGGDGIRRLGGPQASASAGSAGDLDINFNAQRTAALLSSRDDIQSAVSDMLRARVPRLQQCFERHLKQNEDLRGQWRLAFVIGEDGVAADASATGVQMSDAAFERCIESEMAAWRIYGRLAKAWPVSLPVSFKNEG